MTTHAFPQPLGGNDRSQPAQPIEQFGLNLFVKVAREFGPSMQRFHERVLHLQAPCRSEAALAVLKVRLEFFDFGCPASTGPASFKSRTITRTTWNKKR